MGDEEMHVAGANPTGDRLAASYGLFKAFKEEATKHNMDVETAFRIFAETRKVFAEIEQGAGSSKPHPLSHTPMEQNPNPLQGSLPCDTHQKAARGNPESTIGLRRSVPFTQEQQVDICKRVLEARERIANGQNSGVGYKVKDGYNEVAKELNSTRSRIKRVCERRGYAYQPEGLTDPKMTDNSAARSVATSTAPSTTPSAAPPPEQRNGSDHEDAHLLLNFHTGGV